MITTIGTPKSQRSTGIVASTYEPSNYDGLLEKLWRLAIVPVRPDGVCCKPPALPPVCKTTAGEYARTIGEFAPAAFGPESVAGKVASVLVPALTSETAGQVTRQVAPGYEGAARLVGGLIGGGISPTGAEDATAQDVVRQADQFGIPLTRGQATGDFTQQAYEEAARHGAKGTIAGNIMRGMDSAQAHHMQLLDGRGPSPHATERA
jgi:hypothetical protein